MIYATSSLKYWRYVRLGKSFEMRLGQSCLGARGGTRHRRKALYEYLLKHPDGPSRRIGIGDSVLN